jgi:hypothetical protein
MPPIDKQACPPFRLAGAVRAAARQLADGARRSDHAQMGSRISPVWSQSGLMLSIAALTAVVLFAVSDAAAQQLRETRQLTSNNIIALAGSGDTVWLATERGFHYRTSIHTQEGWPGFEASDLGDRFGGLAFGGGAAAAVIRKSTAFPDYDSVGFWHFDHSTGAHQQRFFRFPLHVRGDESFVQGFANPTGHAVYAHGNFWASFNRGGIVRYNPRDGSFRAIRPEDSEEALPQNLGPLEENDSTKTVTAIGIHPENGFIIAVTPAAYWTYDYENKLWAKIDSIPADPIYAAINSYNFRSKFEEAGDIATPKINDILFMPREEPGTGTLVIATATGLYVCKDANPAAGEYGGFVLIRHIREVKGGEAYALPGIIRGGSDSRYNRAVFVYKLRKDGNVTISVYDYRMNLVKTVVRGEPRVSTAERSTVPARDFWDGTNRSGRRAAPGVYYFKITSTGGDRFFGKVILAN